MDEANTDLLTSLREEYGPAKVSETADGGSGDLLSSLRSEYGPADTSKPRGTLSEMGRQFGAGVAVDIPEMAGKAIQAFTEEGGAAHQFGKEIRESAEAREPEWAPDLRDKNEVQKALVQGTRAIPASLAAAAPAFIPLAGPAISAAVTGAGFGGAQYQDTLEKLRDEGVPEEEAKEAALGAAVAQGGGEIIANRLTAGLLGAGKNVAAKTIGELTGKIATGASAKEAAKQFGKAYAAELVGEPATEIAQDVGTEAIERAYGAKPTAEYGDIAYQSGTTALAMAAMLGLPGAGGHYANKKIAERIDTALDNPETSDSARLAAVQGIYVRAKNEGIQDADQWYAGAVDDIRNKVPVRRESGIQAPVAVAAPPIVAEEPIPEAPVAQEAPAAPEVPPVIADVTPQPEPIIEPQPETPDADLISRGRSYVEGYKAKMALGGIPTLVTKKLREVAQSFGVYDPNLKPDEMLSALDARVSELENAQKTPGQRVAESIAGSGWVSDSIASNPEAIDAVLSAKQAAVEETPAAEAPTVEQTEPQGGVYITEDGEIVGERPAEEPDYYAPESLAARDITELESLISAGNLSGQRLAAVNAELLRRKEGGENALDIYETGEIYGGGGEQPGLREGGEGATVSGAGIPPGGQEIGNIQQAAPETPLQQEENINDESQNAAAEEAAAETRPEEVTEAGHPKYVKANNLADAADITERNKATLPKDQIHDGDYQRGFADFDGLHIAIENAAGSFRSGKDESGKEWRQQMHSHYGEIGVRDGDGTLKTGADGDLVDVFINPNPRIKRSPKVYIVDQVNKDGSFDEHKVVLGYPSKAKAKQAYLENYEAGWQGIGAITEKSMDEFKKWLIDEDPKKPVDPNVGKPKPAPKHGPAKERINNRYQLTGNEELQKAVSKLGGLKLDGEIESVFGEYKKRALFNNGANSKYASEAVEILQGLGYQLEDEHALVSALEASLLYSSTRGQSGKPFYTPEGFEKFAERHGLEVSKEDEGQSELNSRIQALLDTTRAFLGQGEYDLMKRIVDRGEVTEANIRDYEQELDGDIARLQEQQKGYEPGPDDFLRGQDMRGANKPKPAFKPEINEDMFVADEAERQALERKQNLAAIEAAKAAKRTGTLESELFTDITVQKDIEDVFEDLLPNKSAKVRSEAQAKLDKNPNAERMQYVEDNFNDLLLELEQSGKVEIKC